MSRHMAHTGRSFCGNCRAESPAWSPEMCSVGSSYFVFLFLFFCHPLKTVSFFMKTHNDPSCLRVTRSVTVLLSDTVCSGHWNRKQMWSCRAQAAPYRTGSQTGRCPGGWQKVTGSCQLTKPVCVPAPTAPGGPQLPGKVPGRHQGPLRPCPPRLGLSSFWKYHFYCFLSCVHSAV